MLDSIEMPVVNVSGTGVLIDGGPDWIVLGQGLQFKFVISIRNEDNYISSHGTVVRIESRGIAVQYESPYPNWGQMLTNYLKTRT